MCGKEKGLLAVGKTVCGWHARCSLAGVASCRAAIATHTEWHRPAPRTCATCTVVCGDRTPCGNLRLSWKAWGGGRAGAEWRAESSTFYGRQVRAALDATASHAAGLAPCHTDCGTASCNPCCYHLRRPQLTCVKRSAEAQVMPYRLPSMTAISVPVRPWPPQLRKQGTRSPGRSGGNVRGLGVRQDPQVCLNRSCGCYPSPFSQQLHPRHGYPASTQPSTAPVDVHALAAQDARAAIVGEAGHSGIAGHVAVQDGQVQEVQLVLRWEAGEMGLAVGLDGLLCPAPSWWPGEGR